MALARRFIRSALECLPNRSDHISENVSLPLRSIFHAACFMSSKIYVGGLSRYVDHKILKDSFSRFGNITDVILVVKKVKYGVLKGSRGYGFVEFSSKKEADAAIAAMNGKDLRGQKLQVALAYERARIIN